MNPGPEYKDKYTTTFIRQSQSETLPKDPTHLLNSTHETSAPRESFFPGMMGADRLVTSHTVTSESEEPQATKLA